MLAVLVMGVAGCNVRMIGAGGAPDAGGAMVPVPEGDFAMGAWGDDSARAPSKIHMTPFAIDRLEVTVGQYDQCVAARKCTPVDVRAPRCNASRKRRGEQPVTCVDYAQAQAYCAYARKRLPTEEQWEYAARGSDGRAYPWGSEAPSSSSAVCAFRLALQEGPCLVGSGAQDKSPFGALDMAGNVFEWTSSLVSPTGTNQRVIRGESWEAMRPEQLRVTGRSGEDPRFRSDALGFRCVN